MQVRTFFHSWVEVPDERALKWAQTLYHMTTQYPNGFRNKTEYINSRIKGKQFTREELEL